MENIIVIEVYDRSISSVTPCNTKEEAIETANELLKIHCNTTGYGDRLEETVQEAQANGTEPGWGDFRFASTDNDNAWCNYGNCDWDAFIVEY